MARLVCLANSHRHDGRCVAGIDIETGEWVRPVPPGGGGVPFQRTCINGQTVAVLDVVEIPLRSSNPGTKYQCENREMRDRPWKLIDKMQPKDIIQYCDRTAPILHTDSDRVSPETLEALSPDEWKSLQLVRARKLSFAPDYFKPQRWRAHFEDSAGNSYSLKVTDPIASDALRQKEEFDKRSILTVSLVEPWAPSDGSLPEMCYKLVAAVIEL